MKGHDLHDLLPGLTAFVAVVQQGGYSAAARVMGSDKGTLSRRVRSLEDALSVRLLDRTTRSVRPTEAGARLFAASEGSVDALKSALAAVHQGDPVGSVRITSAPGLADELWVPVISALRESHPQIRVFVRSEVSFQSLVATGFDIGVRTGKLPVTSDIARPLMTWRYVAVASPEWASRHPDASPESHEDGWLFHSQRAHAAPWRFVLRGGRSVTRSIAPITVSEDFRLLRGMALLGEGVYLVAPPLIAADLREGALQRVFPDWRVDHTHTIYSVVPHREHPAPATTVVLDAVAEHGARLEQAWKAFSE
ncbi:MAG: LysR family transcriptional regulator [Myxococcota bacterium]